MSTTHSTRSKDFITARSLPGLRRKMLELNKVAKGQILFGEPSQFKNNRGNYEFMVWYERDFTREEINEILLKRNR